MNVPVDRITEVVADAVRESLTRIGASPLAPQRVHIQPQTGTGGVSPSSLPSDNGNSVNRRMEGSERRVTAYQRASGLQTTTRRSISTTPGPESRRRFAPPTMFKPKRARRGSSSPKPISYVRDIVCLPKELQAPDGNIHIPRGSRRTELADAGLLGKIQFSSVMSAQEMRSEICRVFAVPMGLCEVDIEAEKLFPFVYLQRTGAGSRSLCVPAVSQSFEWNGRQVATLAKSGGFIYILAGQDLSKPVKVCELEWNSSNLDTLGPKTCVD